MSKIHMEVMLSTEFLKRNALTWKMKMRDWLQSYQESKKKCSQLPIDRTSNRQVIYLIKTIQIYLIDPN